MHSVIREPALFLSEFPRNNPEKLNLLRSEFLGSSVRHLSLWLQKEIDADFPNLKGGDKTARKERLLQLANQLKEADQMTYDEYWDLFFQAASGVKSAFELDDPRLLVRWALAQGIVCIPVFQENPLTQREILRLNARGIAPIQLPHREHQADGSMLDPGRFAAHDAGHASIASLAITYFPPNHGEPILKNSPADSAIRGAKMDYLLDRLDASSLTATEKRIVEETLFELLHEKPFSFSGNGIPFYALFGGRIQVGQGANLSRDQRRAYTWLNDILKKLAELTPADSTSDATRP